MREIQTGSSLDGAQNAFCCVAILRHSVVTAVDVDPRMTPAGSANWKATRLRAGSGGMLPLAFRNAVQVVLWFWPIVAVTVVAGGERHCPVVGLVWQMVAVSAIDGSSGMTWAVSGAPDPILVAAITKTPVPPAPPVRE